MEIDAGVCVSITKTSIWSGLQISLNGRKQVTKDSSDLREILTMDSVTTIKLFGNPNMITNILKAEIHKNLLTSAGSKMVDGAVEIPSAGQTKLHAEII